MTTKNQLDTIVIGGGIAGLIAAARLARGGRRVTLLERSKHVGGRGRSERVDGHTLNLGPHALYRKRGFEDALTDLDVPFDAPRAVPNGFLLDGDRRHTLVTGFVSLLTTGALDLPGKLAVASFMAKMPRIDLETIANESVSAYVERNFPASAHRFVRSLARLATYTDDPDALSAGVMIDQLRTATFEGVGYPSGGWQSLVDGLVDAATAAGVELRTGVRADDVRVGADGVTVTGPDGRWNGADVVLATSPSVAAKLTGSLRLAKIAEAARPVRAATLCVALSTLPRPKHTFALGIDEPTYFSVHSAFGDLAPRGAATIHCARYLGPNDALDAEAIEAGFERILDGLQPGWRDRLVHRRFLPKLLVAHDTPLASDGGVAGRPDVDVAGDRVWVAGDWVGPDDLLADASAASASRAAERILSTVRTSSARSAA